MGPARFPGAEQGLHQVSEALLPLVAVVAGVISFSSPCCLPLVPGYLSYVSALPVAELGERDARRVTLRAALLFVGGFTMVFTVLGVGASALGSVLLRNQDELTRWFGVVIILLGLSTMGLLRVPFLLREKRLTLRGCRVGRPGRSRWAWPSPSVGPRASDQRSPPSWRQPPSAARRSGAGSSSRSTPWGSASPSSSSLWAGTVPTDQFAGYATTAGPSSAPAGCCWCSSVSCSSAGAGRSSSGPCSGGSRRPAGRRSDRLETTLCRR